ncbi:hypothetical protein [Blastococcus tunisiensis]|jgi:hypothetical protein|uniref:Chemotaxis phosphatase CheX n=1 Tax=Blastococcus tunisiensis TaxID=1798228 RepID=A0A1I2KCE9_9ACTN|nr:hypothetical protein [Blastococcus sp. DSM 46838]SFF63890.1 hypothetical protein SAMN05216574_12056 [Blastococcus sp. DSM 46838]
MSTGTVQLPAPKDVRDMLTGLVGKPVAVDAGGPVTPTPDKPVSVAVYVDPQMAINALCVMDLGASAYTGAALALLPPGGAQDAVEEDGELTGMLVEALHEVVNVLSALFNVPGAPHSKLHKLYAPGEDLPGDIEGMLANFNRLDLAIEVPGYGKGGISLVLP